MLYANLSIQKEPRKVEEGTTKKTEFGAKRGKLVYVGRLKIPTSQISCSFKETSFWINVSKIMKNRIVFKDIKHQKFAQNRNLLDT